MTPTLREPVVTALLPSANSYLVRRISSPGKATARPFVSRTAPISIHTQGFSKLGWVQVSVQQVSNVAVE